MHPHVIQQEMLEELRKQSFILNKEQSDKSMLTVRIGELELQLKSLHGKFVKMAELNAELTGMVANLTEIVNELDLMVDRFDKDKTKSSSEKKSGRRKA
jgi:uncharacterized coiled-coil protein SlyX